MKRVLGEGRRKEYVGILDGNPLFHPVELGISLHHSPSIF